MTLAQWQAKYPSAIVRDYPNGAKQIFTDELSAEAEAELWRLADFRVSSRVSGPSIILVAVR